MGSYDTHVRRPSNRAILILSTHTTRSCGRLGAVQIRHAGHAKFGGPSGIKSLCVNEPTTAASPARRTIPNLSQHYYIHGAQAAHLLSCSVATLIRAEARSDLHAVRLNPKGNGKVYYSAADVHASLMVAPRIARREVARLARGIAGGDVEYALIHFLKRRKKGSRTKPSSAFPEAVRYGARDQIGAGRIPFIQEYQSNSCEKR